MVPRISPPEKKSASVLLTFTGFHDPYALGMIGDEEHSGPILSLVEGMRQASRPFDSVVLFSTPNTEKHTGKTREAFEKLHPDIEVIIKDLPLLDPTDYPSILRELRRHMGEFLEEMPKAKFYVAVASGTPQMHACWLLLVGSGEFPARILNIRPRRFVSKDLPLITEVDLTSPEFPVVTPNVFANEQDTPIADSSTAIRQIGLVGDHPKMRKAIETAVSVAESGASVILVGESGTGKELFAKLIHRLSDRAKAPFVPVNCAAIPKELFESQFFGHKKGSFTGATTDHVGKFMQADTGTLFLDEVTELTLPFQAKLLRVLEDKVVEPIGAAKSRKVEVRIVSATNKDIRGLIKQGQFRSDLYHRLNVATIHIPPLRERRSDIPKIAAFLLEEINKSLKRPKRFSQSFIARLREYPWLGNIRELRNAIERSACTAKNEIIDASDFDTTGFIDDEDGAADLPEPHDGFSLRSYTFDVRAKLILRAVELADNNLSKAARLLSISPQAVQKALERIRGSSTKVEGI